MHLLQRLHERNRNAVAIQSTTKFIFACRIKYATDLVFRVIARGSDVGLRPCFSRELRIFSPILRPLKVD